MKGLNEIVKILAPLYKNPHQLDLNRNTPMHYAAENGHLEVVKTLATFTNDPNPSSGTIPGQPKKCYPGGKFPGINSKNLPAAFGGQKIFSPPLSPRGTNCQNFFTHGIPIGYSQGCLHKKNLPALTPQGSFLEKF